MSSKTTLIIPTLSADHAVEIRKAVLPDGKVRTEALMNNGARRVTFTWRENGVTNFTATDHPLIDGWLDADDGYLSIVRRNPRTGDWDSIR